MNKSKIFLHFPTGPVCSHRRYLFDMVKAVFTRKTSHKNHQQLTKLATIYWSLLNQYSSGFGREVGEIL